LTHIAGVSDWRPITGAEEITSYSFLEKKDGSINIKAIENLRDVFGWNGDLDAIPTFVGKNCQVTIEPDTYNGVTRMKVKWLNHADDSGGGGIEAVDSERLAAFKARLGPQLRASIGGTVIPPPPKTPTPERQPGEDDGDVKQSPPKLSKKQQKLKDEIPY
jgi:hypothetical protein